MLLWLLMSANDAASVRNKDSSIRYSNKGCREPIVVERRPPALCFNWPNSSGEMNDLEHFVGFLDRYIEVFPKLLEDDIYLAGESFAGQYIPYIAKAILEKRSVLKLRGLIIGSGWIDPVSLYDSYLPYAIANNLLKNDSALYTNVTQIVKKCEQAVANGVHVFTNECNSILDQIMNNGVTNEYSSCINVYHIRQNASKPECGMKGPSEIEYVSAYLSRMDVMSSLHVNKKIHYWKDVTDPVYFAFQAVNSRPSIEILPDLLRQIPILIYASEYDFICNYFGTENMLNRMQWNERIGFDLGSGLIAPSNPWMVENELAGRIRYARNLTYILFYNAGHMVPSNQARRSQAMLYQFIQLNSTYLNNGTLDDDYSKTKQKKYDSFKNMALVLTMTVVIAFISIGFTWFFLCKLRAHEIILLCQRLSLFRSKEQSVVYQRFRSLDDDSVTFDGDPST
ncbi:unnamed protein product [Adineta ricciae]|uniref:Pheromone-processing carboxypeptidase KEX1 n=1 Tax=Adineta ricciae TaxID=249248 RepID=A0A815GKE1_ADIRI|nr:unnamed protein product [Adineta ricciae]